MPAPPEGSEPATVSTTGRVLEEEEDMVLQRGMGEGAYGGGGLYFICTRTKYKYVSTYRLAFRYLAT